MAAIAKWHSPCSRAPPGLRPHQRSRRQLRDRLIAAVTQQRWPAAADQQRSGGGGSSGGAQPLLLAAVQVLAALQLVLPPPSLADGNDFTIRSAPPAGDVEEDYFETVPQGLDSTDSSTAPRLGSLIEGPKGKKARRGLWSCLCAGLWGAPGAASLPSLQRRSSSGSDAPVQRRRAPRAGSVVQVQQCTRKCVPTCIRGGQGSPGLGPMTLR